MDQGRDRTLKCKGQTWTFRFGNAAYRLFEREAGKPLGALLNGEDANASVTDVTCLIWAGLRQYHPKVTLEQVDAILDELGYAAAMEVVRDAVLASQPPPDQARGESGGDPLAGTAT